MRLGELEGARVGILGYGKEGQCAASLLSREYPRQTLTIFTPEALALDVWLPENAQLIEGQFTAGQFAACDILIKSPGISLYHPAVQSAINAGLRMTSGSQLWFAEPPHSRVAIISGSKGKSTTCALTVFLLQAAGRQAMAAGNIGVPLLDLWLREQAPDFLLVELSSYQTADFQGQAEIALLTNLFPEHTDWHGSTQRYYDDKLRLFERPSKQCFANAMDATSQQRLSASAAMQWFNQNDGWQVSAKGVFRAGKKVADRPAWQLPGDHNLSNLAAALTIVDAFGVAVQPGLEQLRDFTGLPHRLQSLGQVCGVRLVDDSIATAPQATIAALAALQGELVSVIVGGFDRDLDWSVFARYLLAHPVHRVITQGDNGPKIARLLTAKIPQQPLVERPDLASAVKQGLADTPRGGVLLLSPGAPSYGQFKDFEQRGRQFARLAGLSEQ